MSRRFGRNQRRRAREALANAINQNHGLQQSLELTLAFMRDLAQRKAYLQDALHAIAEMLPEGSALLPPGRISAKDRMAAQSIHHPVDVDVSRRIDPIGGVDGPLTANWEPFYVERLISAVATFSEGELDRRVHFEVEFAGNHVVYALNQSALDSMPRHRLCEALRNTIAAQLAKQLTDRIKP